ncbi:MAG TPA: hypothetical protein VFP40_00310 [Terriglobales bacterium]|nr:hypothetical protein [Terriglobales bacterium]
MQQPRSALLLAAALALIAIAAIAQSSQSSKEEYKPLTNQTISGLVRDIACPIQNHESTARKFNRQCALDCARKGSPLAILTDDGTMYLPISEGMPDTDQRPRLMPFVGKYVRVKGDVYERKGLHAIVIKEINEDPSVKVEGDAFQPE